MTNFSGSEMSSAELPPPPKSRNPWKIAAVALGVLVAVFVLLVVIGTFASDNRNEKLADKLPSSIESNFRDKGIDVSVSSVSCEDLPAGDATFSIRCDVTIEEIDEVVEATVQGSVNDDLIQIDDIFSEERLLTLEKAIEYVQGLVDGATEGVVVLDCDIGGSLAVIRPGSEFTCELDSAETVLITVANDGSAAISDVFATGGA